MKAHARRLARLQQALAPKRSPDEPETLIYLPCKERDGSPPGRYGAVIIYRPGDPNDPNREGRDPRTI